MALTGLTNLQPLHIKTVGIGTFDNTVSIGGTLTYEDVTNVDAIGIITARSGINVSGGQLDIGSNIKIGNAGVITATSFSGSGANLTNINLLNDSSPQLGGDLDTNDHHILLDQDHYLYFSNLGGSKFLGLAGGGLYLQNNGDLHLRGDDVYIRGDDNSVCAKFIEGGASELYHNGNKTLETTVNALHLTGNSSECNLKFMDSGGTQRYLIGVTNSNSVIHYSGEGDKILEYINNGAVNLHHNNDLRLETTSTGVNIPCSSGATVRVGGTSGSLYRSGSPGAGIHFSGDAILPVDGAGAVNNGGTDLGHSSYRFRKTYTNSVHFAAVGGSTKSEITDYQEGSFTPTLGTHLGAATVSYTYQRGAYTKIGRLVFCWFDVAWSSLSQYGSGSTAIRGFPYTVQFGSSHGGYGAPNFRSANGMNTDFRIYGSSSWWWTDSGQNVIILMHYTSNGTETLSSFNNSGRVTGSGFYTTSQ